MQWCLRLESIRQNIHRYKNRRISPVVLSIFGTCSNNGRTPRPTNHAWQQQRRGASTAADHGLENTTHHDELEQPTVLFHSNRLILVNKPPGWSCVCVRPHAPYQVHNIYSKLQSLLADDPEAYKDSQHALVRYLMEHRYYRQGSDQNRHDNDVEEDQSDHENTDDFQPPTAQPFYLIPAHGLDQQCSGLAMFGKRPKSAKRLRKIHNNETKIYYAIVEDPHGTVPRTCPWEPFEWMTLEGFYEKRVQTHREGEPNVLEREMRPKMIMMRSAEVPPVPANDTAEPLFFIDLQYRPVPRRIEPSEARQPQVLLEIKTPHAAGQFMVRAALAAHGLPVVGDEQYGASCAIPIAASSPSSSSVIALHARCLFVRPHIDLGPPLNKLQRTLSAPIPTQWSTAFDWDPASDVEAWEQTCLKQGKHSF